MSRRKYNYSVISKELFDINYSNPEAEIAIVGISPGPSQFEKQKDIKEKGERNRVCAFAGRMRDNLIAMLDDKGLKINNFLGINSCESLWGENFHLALHTSILPYSVIRLDGNIPEEIFDKSDVDTYKKEYQKSHDGKSDGFYISKISYSAIQKSNNLKQNFNKFIDSISQCNKLKVIIVLGGAYDIIKAAIKNNELYLDEKIIINIPHAAGSNAGKIKGFIDAAGGKNWTSDMATQTINGYKMYDLAKKKFDSLKD